MSDTEDPWARAIGRRVLGGEEVPLAEMELSVRAGHCLAYADIATINELCLMSEPALLNIRNLGKTCAAEIKGKLEAMGLRLHMKALPRAVECCCGGCYG